MKATDLQPVELDRLLPRLEALAQVVERLFTEFAGLATRMKIGPVSNLAGANRILDLLRAVLALPPGADAMVAAMATTRPVGVPRYRRRR